MKKKLTALALSLFLALAPGAALAEDFTPITGREMLDKFGVGINIGNTLDAYPNWDGYTGGHMDYETCWGEAKIERSHFEEIARMGFASVRIPVSWGVHMDDDYTVYEEWMDRVQQCVDWALGEGLYVILNTHHENEFYRMLDSGQLDEAEEWLTAVWAQISERFGDYSEKLVFEPMNEPHRIIKGGWIWDSFIDGVGIVDEELCEKVERMNAAALKTIRESGGNNAQRVVALTTAGANADSLPFHTLPEDDPYTVLCVFFYPDDNFRNIRNAADAGVPLFIKEIAPGYDPSEISPSVDVMTGWTEYYFGEFAAMGIPSFWWNHNDNDGRQDKLLDRRAMEWTAPELLRAFFAAYGEAPALAEEESLVILLPEPTPEPTPQPEETAPPAEPEPPAPSDESDGFQWWIVLVCAAAAGLCVWLILKRKKK
ncbi:MAG: glycoside hydrolase family 5 protein [Oscillospiraceae bacterium]|nr:glycoside hydrolase family 5 protein [Oscillospiraceae bacterium]